MNAERLESNFNAASAALRKAIGGKQGESNEIKYGQAYTALVKAGLRPPLKGKYR